MSYIYISLLFIKSAQILTTTYFVRRRVLKRCNGRPHTMDDYRHDDIGGSMREMRLPRRAIFRQQVNTLRFRRPRACLKSSSRIEGITTTSPYRARAIDTASAFDIFRRHGQRGRR